MTEETKLTGYPSIDKPWMKYYDPALADQPLPEKTVYEFMQDTASLHPDKPAFTFYGGVITYREFLANIETAARILASIGVTKGDRVMYLMGNLPETAYLFYGGSRLGAVADFIDPRPHSIDYDVSARKTLGMVKAEGIRFLVSLDSCYLAMIAPVEEELLEAGVRDVIIVSPSRGMTRRQQRFYLREFAAFNGVGALLRKMKSQSAIGKKFDAAREVSKLRLHLYDEIAAQVDGVTFKDVIFEPRRLTAITHSSGTTGNAPKAIPLTNENINSYSFQLMRSNVNQDVGDNYLHILPYFSAYGLGLSHMGFSSADNMIEVPEFQPKDLGRYIAKYKPAILMGTPNWYLALPDDPVIKAIDLSFIRTIGYGGDSMNPEAEMEVNDYLASRGAKVKITKDHGMSETSGGASYAIDEYNIPGSMGVPMIDTIYGVVDPETKELVRFESGIDTIQGEFIISSPATVSETLDGRTVIRHGEYHGEDFIYTGDLGTMNRNGVLFFLSRSDRTFTRYDGYKIKPYEIEGVLRAHPKVKDCVITSFEDEDKHGKMPIAHIIPDRQLHTRQELVNMTREIIDACFIHNPNVSSRQIPSRIAFHEAFPISKNGKLDYKALDATPLTGDEIAVVFEETTIELGEIKVY